MMCKKVRKLEVFHPRPGDYIGVAVDEALKIAKKLNREVTFTFNDTVVHVHPDKQRGEIIEHYYADRIV